MPVMTTNGFVRNTVVLSLPARSIIVLSRIPAALLPMEERSTSEMTLPHLETVDLCLINLIIGSESIRTVPAVKESTPEF